MNGEDQAPQPVPPDDLSRLEQETGDLTDTQEQLDEALREKDQFRKMAQRSLADLINYKRRAADEMDQLRRSSTSSLLLRMLSFVDDLERAISMVPEDAVAPGWLEGLLLVHRNVINTLDSEGVSKIEALGRPFEPWELEAVSYQETAEAEDGKVIEVLREGYRHYDKVLRAAQVVVAKRPQQQVQSETTHEEDL